MKNIKDRLQIIKRFLGLQLLITVNCLHGQPNHIDAIRQDAPELAHYGDYNVGVRTLSFNDPGRLDVLKMKEGNEPQHYDRSLTVEIWYPAQLTPGQLPGGQYSAMTRNPKITATLYGKGVRDAAALKQEGKFPLVIISHGYPGNRFLMAHLGENLASKGYVVASIDHTDSTYDDIQAFPSTLYNRPLDQRFILSQLATLSKNSSSFLNGFLNADTTAVIGYSMGGYGLVNNIGGGFSDDMGSDNPSLKRLLNRHTTGNSDYLSQLDSRIKAGVAIAPWGMTSKYWKPEDLKGIEVPVLYISGSVDVVAGYENGTRAIFENAVSSDRYLLTFQNAGHNAAAPMPVPVEILQSGDTVNPRHYIDSVWDNLRMNNITAHFVTAFLDYKLKGDTMAKTYLDLVPNAKDGIYSLENDRETGEHTYWKGFPLNTAMGLTLEHRFPGQ
ncbi:MAG: dienelactone hydrolase [Verrucomicrobia bacterium]|nr:dienelactone hydrolase [Verrucomicrobiota bacterium]MDA1066946.1 dienelactone hydrolase [Verrucomicrobiota bacterium]